MPRDFDVVIHCAGLVDLSSAESAPALAHELNVESVRTVRDALRDVPTKVVLLSTDNVFDGTRDTYTELDPPTPVNVYGRTKVAAEEVLGADARHLVVRIPMIVGRSPWRDAFLLVARLIVGWPVVRRVLQDFGDEPSDVVVFLEELP